MFPQSQPLSPPVRITHSAPHSTPSANFATQPPLFKDTQNLPSATESTLEETIISREIDEFFHEITLDGDEDDEFPGVMEAKRRRLQSPFTHVNESLCYDDSAHTQNNHDVGDPSKNDRDDGITHNQRDIAHTQVVNEEKEHDQDDFRDNSEKRMAFLIDQAVETVDAKDRQIESLTDEIARLANITGDLIKGHEDGMKRMTEESGIMNVLVNDEVKTQRADISNLQREIREREERLEQKQTLFSAELEITKNLLNAQKQSPVTRSFSVQTSPETTVPPAAATVTTTATTATPITTATAAATTTATTTTTTTTTHNLTGRVLYEIKL